MRSDGRLEETPQSVSPGLEQWRRAAQGAAVEDEGGIRAAGSHPQLERDGTVDAADNGAPVFKDEVDGHWYCTVSALNGVIEAYEIHERRYGRNLSLEPLRQLSNKLKYGMPIFESDTKAARASLNRMRIETMQMTADYAKQLIKDFQIKEALEKVAA